MPINRRSFLTLLGAPAFPPPAFGQAAFGSQRIVAVEWALPAGDARIPGSVTAVLRGLADQGWIDGENLRLVTLAGGLDRGMARANAQQMSALNPDVYISGGLISTQELLPYSGSTPVVFFAVADPVGAGFVESLRRPGGNITGFSNVDASLGGKWLELLRELRPELSYVALILNAATSAGYVQSFQEGAERMGISGSVMSVGSVEEIVTSIADVGTRPHGGIVVSPDAFLLTHRLDVVRAAAAARVPAVYCYRDYLDVGGLMSYSADPAVWLRGVGAYAGRILNGDPPAELPIQFPSVFTLSINIGAAAEIGISVPPLLLAIANEILE